SQPEVALSSFRTALKIKPDYAEAHNNLGNTLKELGNLDAAAESYRRALEIKPNHTETLTNLGNVLKDLGQAKDAAASYRRALEIDPAYDKALLGVSQLYAISGKMDEAEVMVKKALAIKPDNLEARVLLANARKVHPGDENLAALLAIEETARNSESPMSYQKMIPLHFALGKCFDDLGDHERAFPHFLEGCKLKRATVNYDTAQMTQQFDNVMRVFDQASIERLRGGGNPSHVPIFVLGMPRSGTTLTEQIIASHPEVYGAGELPDLQAIAQREVAGTTGFPGNILALDQAGLTRWADDYVAGLRQRAPDAMHITDKMPGNFWYIGLINVMLPNARIIHVNRNPVDTCLSCFTILFNTLIQTYDLAELGRYYVDYARLMDHWRKVLPAGAFLDVQYEEIVADQDTQARRIIDFCGLEWSDACIDFHNSKRAVNTASVTQVRQPIYKSSVERWRPYEKYLGPLLDALGDLAPERKRVG
ncbi:MAG: sulfotransferase, partial [Gallionella sp.]|nr:sulfotransferase [Gallionella sp.]